MTSVGRIEIVIQCNIRGDVTLSVITQVSRAKQFDITDIALCIVEIYNTLKVPRELYFPFETIFSLSAAHFETIFSLSAAHFGKI